MTTFDPLDYIPDYSDRHNCSCIESAKHGKPIRVRVRPEQDASAQSLLATLSLDGERYKVEVTTPEGKTDSFGGDYKDLLSYIRDHKPA